MNPNVTEEKARESKALATTTATAPVGTVGINMIGRPFDITARVGSPLGGDLHLFLPGGLWALTGGDGGSGNDDGNDGGGNTTSTSKSISGQSTASAAAATCLQRQQLKCSAAKAAARSAALRMTCEELEHSLQMVQAQKRRIASVFSNANFYSISLSKSRASSSSTLMSSNFRPSKTTNDAPSPPPEASKRRNVLLDSPPSSLVGSEDGGSGGAVAPLSSSVASTQKQQRDEDHSLVAVLPLPPRVTDGTPDDWYRQFQDNKLAELRAKLRREKKGGDEDEDTDRKNAAQVSEEEEDGDNTTNSQKTEKSDGAKKKKKGGGFSFGSMISNAFSNLGTKLEKSTFVASLNNEAKIREQHKADALRKLNKYFPAVAASVTIDCSSANEANDKREKEKEEKKSKTKEGVDVDCSGECGASNGAKTGSGGGGAKAVPIGGENKNSGSAFVCAFDSEIVHDGQILDAHLILTTKHLCVIAKGSRYAAAEEDVVVSAIFDDELNDDVSDDDGDDLYQPPVAQNETCCCGDSSTADKRSAEAPQPAAVKKEERLVPPLSPPPSRANVVTPPPPPPPTADPTHHQIEGGTRATEPDAEEDEILDFVKRLNLKRGPNSACSSPSFSSRAPQVPSTTGMAALKSPSGTESGGEGSPNPSGNGGDGGLTPSPVTSTDADIATISPSRVSMSVSDGKKDEAEGKSSQKTKQAALKKLAKEEAKQEKRQEKERRSIKSCVMLANGCRSASTQQPQPYTVDYKLVTHAIPLASILTYTYGHSVPVIPPQSAHLPQHSRTASGALFGVHHSRGGSSVGGDGLMPSVSSPTSAAAASRIVYANDTYRKGEHFRVMACDAPMGTTDTPTGPASPTPLCSAPAGGGVGASPLASSSSAGGVVPAGPDGLQLYTVTRPSAFQLPSSNSSTDRIDTDQARSRPQTHILEFRRFTHALSSMCPNSQFMADGKANRRSFVERFVAFLDPHWRRELIGKAASSSAQPRQ